MTGTIAAHSAALNPLRLGLNVQTSVRVKLERLTDNDVEHFEREFSAIEQTASCFATTGEYDFLLHVVSPDSEALKSH